jgi:hypothetical protein
MYEEMIQFPEGEVFEYTFDLIFKRKDSDEAFFD